MTTDLIMRVNVRTTTTTTTACSGVSVSRAISYQVGTIFFPVGITPLRSDWSLSCDHGLDYAS